MMREIRVTIYEAHELSEEAFDHAYNEWLEHYHYVWGEENRQTLKAFERIFPVKVVYYEYDAYNYSYVFEFTENAIANLTGIRLLRYLYNNYWHDITEGKYYSRRGKSRRSKVIVSFDCPLTGYYLDNVILGPVMDFLRNPREGITFKQLMNECLDAWGQGCVEDVRYCTSQEAFIEECEANGWEFFEDGRRV